MKNTLIALVAALTFGSAINASADIIEGSITFAGDFVPTGGTIDTDTGISALGDATGLDFINDDFFVITATEDFADAGISFGTIGTYHDFTFAPLTAGTIIWEVGGFEFTLNTISIQDQDNNFIALSGTGKINGNGFDSTSGTWSLSGNSAGSDNSLFVFSAGATAASEPGVLALLGLGFVGLSIARRRQTAK